MLLVFSIVWFAPGIIIRRWAQKRNETAKKKAQAEAIAKLYPKEK